MNEQNSNSANNITAFILVIALTAVVIGGIAYAEHSKTVDELNTMIEQKADDQKVTTENTTETSGAPSGNTDSADVDTPTRIALTTKTIGEHFSALDTNNTKLNNDNANTTKNIVDTESGLSFDVPFNEMWGNEKFSFTPFEKTGNFLKFGSIIPFENGWNREYFLEIQAKKEKDTLMTELASQNPTTMTLNSFNIVKIVEIGMCENPTYYVLGESNTYRLSTLCKVGGEQESKTLEDVIQTLKETQE